MFSTILAQDEDSEVIQLSGLVLTGDSLMPVQYCNIIIKGTPWGTASNLDGFFSLVAETGDTIHFSALGFKTKDYVIPMSLHDDRYSVIQMLTRDTINLAETIIHAWPTPEQFRHDFMNLDIPDDAISIAEKNLERETLREMGETLAHDGNEHYDTFIRDYQASFYHYGQVPRMRIFEPAAWIEFIQAWKRGDFQKKD